MPWVFAIAVWFLMLTRTFVPGEPISVAFTDVTDSAGIQWRQFSGESQDRFLIETSCGGVAFIDYDNDGLLDVYLINGGETPRGKSLVPVRNALYHNLGKGRFEEVAAQAGLSQFPGFGMGLAVADYDNDGFQDLLVTGYPRCALFRNNGDGAFSDVTERSGLMNQGEWAASAAWLDYDRDGWLDLFVCDYAALSFEKAAPCQFAGKPVYCDQRSYEASRSKLFRNQGDGSFADVSVQAGIRQFKGRAFGVVSIDADDDGWPDLFVASDATPNLLLLNKHDGTFQDMGFNLDVAFDSEGMARSGMGVDADDLNGDGLPDFVVTNFHDEQHALFLSSPQRPYQAWSRESGLARLTRSYVGWGVGFLDYDNDGNEDLLIVNGHVTAAIEQIRKDIRYKEPPLLLRNRGQAVFDDMKGEAGPAFSRDYAGRGLALGDFDNDGATDAIFACLNDRPVLLHNQIGSKHGWIGFQFKGTKSNRDAIGTKATISLGTRRSTQWVKGGASFLASHDKRLLFGLGEVRPSEKVSIDIRWPNGISQSVSALDVNRYHKILEPSPGSKH